MEENAKSDFLCFNEKMKDGDGGEACVIIRFEDMYLYNEQIVEARDILGDAAQKLRDLLGL